MRHIRQTRSTRSCASFQSTTRRDSLWLSGPPQAVLATQNRGDSGLRPSPGSGTRQNDEPEGCYTGDSAHLERNQSWCAPGGCCAELPLPGGRVNLRAVLSRYSYSGFAVAPRRESLSQRTFSIIKTDAVRKGYTGAILAEIEKAGFKIVAIKRMSISKAQAEGFYYVHAGRPC